MFLYSYSDILISGYGVNMTSRYGAKEICSYLVI